MVDTSLALVIAALPIIAFCVYLLFDIKQRVDTIEAKITYQVNPDSEIYTEAAGQIIRLQKFIHKQRDEAIDEAYSGEDTRSTPSD
jgi:hypothetical protein